MLGQIAWNVNSSFDPGGRAAVRDDGRDPHPQPPLRAPVHGAVPLAGPASRRACCTPTSPSARCLAPSPARARPARRPLARCRCRPFGPRTTASAGDRILAAGGTLDILIPPSITMIIYGVLAEESIGRLYLAGFIPGFLLAGIFMFIIAVAAKIWPSVAPREASAVLARPPAGLAVAVSRVRADVYRAGHHLSRGGHPDRGGGLWGGGEPHPGGPEPQGERSDAEGDHGDHGAHPPDDHAHRDLGVHPELRAGDSRRSGAAHRLVSSCSSRR